MNGDGYSDVIVGTYGDDNGEGRAYVYHGSATGLSTSYAWTAEGNQSNAFFGRSIASAGDVNGDGYSDVIVGAYLYDNGEDGEGRAYVYHRSATGLSTSYAWTAESNQSHASFGKSVASAGYVNGDGYSDVIVGAYGCDKCECCGGRAFVYHGNGGLGLSLIPAQRNSDNSAPIAQLGRLDSMHEFRLTALDRTPYGRSMVKLEWEVKPLGIPFDGIGTQKSASWTDTGTAGADLNELVSSLTEYTCYHWRMRILYHPVSTPFQPHSRWFSQPGNGWQETDLRTLPENFVPPLPNLVFAITPNSRLAQVGTPVTIFMSVINAGTGSATDVSISQASSLPATISYQAWNGVTLTGTPDTPMDIGSGETVNYVLVIDATAEFVSSAMTFDVSGTNSGSAPISGVNTLTMAASTTPYADVIMMSTSLDVSTAVNTPTAFALATTNVGSANATDVSLVVDIPSSITGLVYQVNETNPDGSIKGPATGLDIPVGGTPTFAVFLTPTEVIDYDPANNRIVLKLVDGSGKVVGAQSVAVSTT